MQSKKCENWKMWKMSLKKAELICCIPISYAWEILGQTEAHRFQTFDIFDTVFSLF